MYTQYLITIISSSLLMKMSLTNILLTISLAIQVLRQEKYGKVESDNAWYGCSVVREVNKNVWIVCVRVKGNMNWECNSGRVKMSLAAHAHFWDKSWGADLPSHLFSPSFVLCFLLSLSLFFSCTYTFHILLFQLSYPWPYLLKIHLSPSLYIWLTR